MNENMEVLTPKNQNSKSLATSTVLKQKDMNRIDFDLPASNIESSLSILNLTDIDVSNIASTERNIEDLLQMQREKANATLNRVSAIPSYLLKPDKAIAMEPCVRLEFDSTISEADLLKSVQSASTPRNSSNENHLTMQSAVVPRESIFAKFRSILDTDISTDNVLEEFKQIAQGLHSLA